MVKVRPILYIVQTDVFCVAFSQQWPTHLSQPEIQKQADMVQSHNRFLHLTT